MGVERVCGKGWVANGWVARGWVASGGGRMNPVDLHRNNRNRVVGDKRVDGKGWVAWVGGMWVGGERVGGKGGWLEGGCGKRVGG